MELVRLIIPVSVEETSKHTGKFVHGHVVSKC